MISESGIQRNEPEKKGTIETPQLEFIRSPEERITVALPTYNMVELKDIATYVHHLYLRWEGSEFGGRRIDNRTDILIAQHRLLIEINQQGEFTIKMCSSLCEDKTGLTKAGVIRHLKRVMISVIRENREYSESLDSENQYYLDSYDNIEEIRDFTSEKKASTSKDNPITLINRTSYFLFEIECTTLNSAKLRFVGVEFPPDPINYTAILFQIRTMLQNGKSIEVLNKIAREKSTHVL